MPECHECGRTIDEGDAFCRACGAATGVAEPAPPRAGDAAPRPPARRDLPFVVVLVAAFSAIAIVLGLVVSFGPSADDFVGVWTAGKDVGVDMTISMKDGTLQASIPGLLGDGAGTSVPGTLSGNTATFDYVADVSTDAVGSVTIAVTLESSDRLRMTMSNIFPGVEASSTVVLMRADSAAAAAASTEQQQKAKDSSVKEGIHSLQVGVQSWAVDHNDRYPRATMMTPDGQVGKMIDNWPANPFTGEPMKASESPGDFTYTVRPDGGGFTLSGHLSDGTDYTVP